MDEETTTNAPVDDGGSQTIQGISVDDQGRAVEPQPNETEQAEAVAPETTEEPSQESPQNEEPAKTDNSTVEWLKKKGIDPSSPEAVEKVAEMARNAEKAMHQKAQQKSELERSVQATQEDLPEDATPAQIDSVRVRNIEIKQNLQDWRINNPDKRELEGEMVKMISEKPKLRAMVLEGYMDFDELYAMAKGSSADIVGNAKSEGKKEALQNLAQKQQAAVPTGNAVNPAGTGDEAITPENVDRLVAKHDLAWFRKNYKAINKAMAG